MTLPSKMRGVIALVIIVLGVLAALWFGCDTTSTRAEVKPQIQAGRSVSDALDDVGRLCIGNEGLSSDAGEAWLARHAIPGKPCDCPREGMWRSEIADALMVRKDIPLVINDSDSDALKELKRRINTMKREFSSCAKNPPDAIDYINKACERCRAPQPE